MERILFNTVNQVCLRKCYISQTMGQRQNRNEKVGIFKAEQGSFQQRQDLAFNFYNLMLKV